MAALRAGDDRQVLLLRQLGGGDDRAHADRVDGDRLLHEHVLAGLDGGLEVDGAEPRRRGGDDEVHVGERADLLVVVESREAAVGRHLHAVRELLREPRQRALDAVGDEVAERDDLDAGDGPSGSRWPRPCPARRSR